MAITSFRGEYAFLSNFWNAPVIYKGQSFTNSEAAYQAQKCANEADKEQFSEFNGGKAKREGRKVAIREDWEDIKLSEMQAIVRAKFSQNPELKEMLLATGDEHIEEANNWGDTIWGTVDGVGENLLGRILMEVRDELREKSKVTLFEENKFINRLLTNE